MPHKLFPSQQENERIYLVVREHWFHLLLKISVWIFFAVILAVFNQYARTNFPGLFEGLLGQIISLLTQIYLLVLILSLFLILVIYYLNIQIITSLRLVDIDQVGLFSHTVSELHLENIEDVTSETNGIFGTVFNYGNVYVQTAATIERFEFDHVPNPAAIEKLLLDLYEKIPHHRRD